MRKGSLLRVLTPLFVLIVFLCCTTQQAHAQRLDWWTKDDTTNNLLVASNSLILIDWAQTREIADNDNYYEVNPHLGRHPSSGDVNRYFLGSLALHNLIGAMLPRRLKRYYYGSQFAYRLSIVGNNAQIGIDLKF